MRFRTLALVAALILGTSQAQAAWDSNAIAQQYIDQGYTRVEVKVGATEAKVEAIKGTTKLEVTYNLATGEIVKTETETIDPGENVSPGVFVESEDEDSLSEQEDSSEDSSDDSEDSSDDDSGDDDDSGEEHEGGED